MLANDSAAPGASFGNPPLRIVAILPPGVLPGDNTVNIGGDDLTLDFLQEIGLDGDIEEVREGERSLNGMCNPTGNRERVRYIPDPGFTGIDQCAYRACDTRGACGEALIRIAVVNS